MKLHTIFVLQGYERKTDTGQLLDTVTYEIVAKTFKEAEKKAQELCKKPFYRLTAVIEKSESNI